MSARKTVSNVELNGKGKKSVRFSISTKNWPYLIFFSKVSTY